MGCGPGFFLWCNQVKQRCICRQSLWVPANAEQCGNPKAHFLTWKVSLRAGLALCQEKCAEAFCPVYLVCLWCGRSSKMASHIWGTHMTTVYVHSVYDKLLEIHRSRNAWFGKKILTLVSWSAETAQGKLVKWQPSSTEISRSFVWILKNLTISP